MHEMRHAEAVMMSEKKKIKSPVIIAPAILVATNVIPRRITDVRTVPRIPRSRVRIEEHRHCSPELLLIYGEATSVARRYATAMPNSTQRKAGVTVMVAVMVRTVVTTPNITPAMTARAVQLLVQLQLVIIFTSVNSICIYTAECDGEYMFIISNHLYNITNSSV